jgi:hypothetical protein
VAPGAAASLCCTHYIEQHSLGSNSFNQKYNIDLWALAKEFVLHSPDSKMRIKKSRADQRRR